MKHSDLTRLRERARVISGRSITQSEIAELLSLSVRTIANWESVDSEKEFAALETSMVSEIFLPRLLVPQIAQMTKQAFEALPSEMVALWVVRRNECLCLEDTSTFAFLNDLQMHRTSAPMIIESLTTYPLRTGEILNLAGSEILNHKAKKYKTNRVNYMFKNGQCESLLHFPSFTPSARGPQPVLLLSFENRISASGEVVKSDGDGKKAFSKNDEKIALHLAEEFRDRILDDMRLLEMII